MKTMSKKLKESTRQSIETFFIHKYSTHDEFDGPKPKVK